MNLGACRTSRCEIKYVCTTIRKSRNGKPGEGKVANCLIAGAKSAKRASGSLCRSLEENGRSGSSRSRDAKKERTLHRERNGTACEGYQKNASFIASASRWGLCVWKSWRPGGLKAHRSARNPAPCCENPRWIPARSAALPRASAAGWEGRAGNGRWRRRRGR